ncbi:MAG: hypothetical protein WC645_02380 [Candidatus Margulisiibacteriota bacterium]
MKLSGREKATIFLSILGPEVSAQVLRYLPGEVADLIASGINHLPTPTPEALGVVLNDFKSYLALPAPGRPISQIEAPPKPSLPREKMTPKDIILSASPKKLAFLLSEERPQVAAIIQSLFPENQKMVRAKTPLAAKVEEKLIKYFASKL